MRHSSVQLNRLAVGTSLVLIGIALILPDFLNQLTLPILLASVFIIGIPHGAIDHIMATELYGLKSSLKDHLLFYASYLFIMLIIAVLWIFAPIAGMILFLLISIYHFGQADMEDFLDTSAPNYLWYILRGVLIIGLIVFSDPSTTYPIISEAMRMDLIAFEEFMPDASLSVLVLLSLYAAFTLWGILQNHFKQNIRFVADSALLTGLILVTGPLIGFAIYFALWHSIGHVNEMKEFFESKRKSLSFMEFYKKATPFTLVSLLGLLMLYGINQFLQLEGEFITLMFILISVLTLPHLFIADKMYREV
ncbi:Brp/Blh family beta-carotene 15,15'-dioxygenase [Rhodohalobacter sp.]|uniref:Brp/Blh family beta-carotene 15,15'-dioxygenase n=1 Tax=Rhodohalobacter sp. TaxID=1974210 RepID=UPI002ACD3535|nr:Brp/Blh family beta-carotene 15,15'-dioxygenase [Rhodohalobacter sp.]MDZ7757319.1 Brp/Blh family beta-carotene 15,15'-dioxygenase [Rhodohalobacter sp.]